MDDKHVYMHTRVHANTDFPSSVLLIPLEHQWVHWANIKESLCVYVEDVGGKKEQHLCVGLCAHLPVKDNTPDEA